MKKRTKFGFVIAVWMMVVCFLPLWNCHTAEALEVNVPLKETQVSETKEEEGETVSIEVSHVYFQTKNRNEEMPIRKERARMQYKWFSNKDSWICVQMQLTKDETKRKTEQTQEQDRQLMMNWSIEGVDGQEERLQTTAIALGNGSYETQLLLPKRFRGCVALQAEDRKGNRSEECWLEYMVIENEEVHALQDTFFLNVIGSATGVDAKGVAIFPNRDVNVEIRAEDMRSGIASIHLMVEGAAVDVALPIDVYFPVEAEDSMSGTVYGGWKINQMDHNLITSVSRRIVVNGGSGSGDICVRGYMVDRAGNVSPWKDMRFRMDAELPALEVSFDENGVQNDRFFNKARTATIVVKDANMDEDGIKLEAKDEKGNVVPHEQWRFCGVDGNGRFVYQCQVKFQEDGEYHLHLQAVDRAGNHTAQIYYPKGTCCPDGFVIDTKIDQWKVEGLRQSVHYSNVVKAVIEGADVHLAEVNVSLWQKKADGSVVEVAKDWFRVTDEENCKRYACDALPRTKAFEGRYQLVVEVSDLAGNREKQTVDFVVNRFGTVYWLGEGVALVNYQYVQSMKQDLLIYEKNPSGIEKHVVEITKDGVIMDHPMDEVKIVSNEDDWQIYQHRISRKNFTKDGIYQVTIRSEDLAGNRSESQAEERNQIRFCVDGTAPVLRNVSGLERESKSDQKITFSAFDAMGLRMIELYVDDERVFQTKEFGEMTEYRGQWVIAEGSHHIRFVVRDLAGNVFDTDAKDDAGKYVWTPSFKFCRDVMVKKSVLDELRLPIHPEQDRTLEDTAIGKEDVNMDMKKIWMRLGIVVVCVLLLAGCGKKKVEKKEQTKREMQMEQGLPYENERNSGKRKKDDKGKNESGTDEGQREEDVNGMSHEEYITVEKLIRESGLTQEEINDVDVGGFIKAYGLTEENWMLFDVHQLMAEYKHGIRQEEPLPADYGYISFGGTVERKMRRGDERDVQIIAVVTKEETYEKSRILDLRNQVLYDGDAMNLMDDEIDEYTPGKMMSEEKVEAVRELLGTVSWDLWNQWHLIGTASQNGNRWDVYFVMKDTEIIHYGGEFEEQPEMIAEIFRI